MAKLQLHPRFVIDAAGRRTGALLDIAEFEQLREGLKELVVVIDEDPDSCDDMLQAAGTALDFWDNPDDAAAWNDYPPM